MLQKAKVHYLRVAASHTCREPHQPRATIELEHIWSRVSVNAEQRRSDDISSVSQGDGTAPGQASDGFVALKRMIFNHFTACLTVQVGAGRTWHGRVRVCDVALPCICNKEQPMFLRSGVLAIFVFIYVYAACLCLCMCLNTCNIATQHMHAFAS
jgi:hypothetical protein